MLLLRLLFSKASMCFLCCHNGNKKCSVLIFLENDEYFDKTTNLNINGITCFMTQTLIILSFSSLVRPFSMM